MNFFSTIFKIFQQEHVQSRIYIGASGSMAPGPEVPGGPFEIKRKIWETYVIKVMGPQKQTGHLIPSGKCSGPHDVRGPTTISRYATNTDFDVTKVAHILRVKIGCAV